MAGETEPHATEPEFSEPLFVVSFATQVLNINVLQIPWEFP
jgi:hypothetical protein